MDMLGATRSSGRLAGLPDSHFIDGGWAAAAAGAMMETCDPGSASPHARFAAGDAEDVARAVDSAARAFPVWSRALPRERGKVLSRAAELVRQDAERLAIAEVLDSGKTLAEARGDVAGAARTFDYYAGAADKNEGRSFPLGENYTSFSVNEPVGVSAHIIPWNYPLSPAARSIAPALAAGCTVVAKPAEQTPMTALILAELLHRAGLPAGACNVVTGTGAAVGAPLAADRRVRHITFTGSTATGIGVMAAAARNVASVTLELGGKSPNIVLADCDIGLAVENVAGAIFENAGQICSAGSRLVIERALHTEFIERLRKRVRALRLGHGLADGIDFGAISSAEHLKKIAGYVEGAKARGVEIVTGGNATVDPATGRGWFFEPTILDGMAWDDPVVQEEIFGPVLVVQPVDDVDEAIAAANCTDLALVAGVFTRDISKALRAAREVDAGQVYVNEYFAGGIETPFGGNRRSGIGREKGLIALASYSKTKSVTIRI
ncbi:aldehyde dehydrogenase family protein [Mesorhizobium sp. NZP2077]|uniref:aldehyde dehydrogenase family protein n=1 Tax=Mesorhizobium sp. NZP2077 TaxID=2483404 RepID=UPI001555475F|nr:aldehyde dehydrogenase family protein [Mesorhizobium sp. NZP2077]QKC85205.1 aldehyde dehydrogenase family protein [Mesorhizobium sp. NZP2077]QKD18842.1 aldehyde dehydrogenase family protein [Mesorhizobium sp. NZP2077]